MKRWFDYWLRGEKNGIMDEPPVTIYIQGANCCRNERDWPPPHTIQRTLYLGGRGSLGERAEREEGEESYTVDPAVGTCAGLRDPTALGARMPMGQTASR